MTGGSVYGFQLAAVFSDATQAGALTAVTEKTMVDDVRGVRILTQTSPLVDNSVDFQWIAPMDPKAGSVFLKVASKFRQRQPLADGRRAGLRSHPQGLGRQSLPGLRGGQRRRGSE